MAKQLEKIALEAKLQHEVDEFNELNRQYNELGEDLQQRLGRMKVLQELLALEEPEEPVD